MQTVALGREDVMLGENPELIADVAANLMKQRIYSVMYAEKPALICEFLEDENPELLTEFNEEVVTEKISLALYREDRDLMVQETLIADLRKKDIELISVHEPDLLADDTSRKLTRRIFGAIAEYDRVMLVTKLKAARQRKKLQTSRGEGILPYGAKPGEASIVIEAPQLHGRSCSVPALPTG